MSYLITYCRVSAVGLWGRSMGATTSLFFMQENPGRVQCAVLDSAFASLELVMEGLVG